MRRVRTSESAFALPADGSKLSPHIEWKDEYAPAEEGGAPPAAESKSWMPAGNGSETQHEPGGGESAFELGPASNGFRTSLSGVLSFVRHLQPETVYYARFHVKDEGGTAEKTFKFTTLPVSKPELEGPTGEGSSREDEVRLEAAAVDPFAAQIEPILQDNGAEETEYQIDVAPAGAGVTPPPEESPAWVPVSAGSSGHLSVAEESVHLKAGATGLSPETIYFARIEAVNHCNQAKPSEKCTLVFTETFQTPTAKPVSGQPGVRNVTGTSAHVSADLNPHGSETAWRFETAPAPGGPWTPAPGAAGTISQAEAQTLLEEETKGHEDAGNAGPDAAYFHTTLAGLQPDSAYYVRLFAHSAAGEAVACHFGEGLPGSHANQLICEPLSTTTQGVASFNTSGAPVATAYATDALQKQAVRLFGDVNPNSAPTSAEQTVTLAGAPTGGTFTLAFKGQSTGGTARGTLTSGSPLVTGISLLPVKGTGNVVKRGVGLRILVTGVQASVGQFHAGDVISGPGIPAGASIGEIDGTTLTLVGEGDSSVETISGVELTSAEPAPFSVGEAVGGAGVLPDTTVAGIEYAADFTATLTLSADATAGGSVELSSRGAAL